MDLGFLKLDIRVGLVKSCEEIPKSRNLYKLMVDCGEKNLRQIVSGISQYYSPEDLINQKIVVLTNLKPRKMMGILSEGMLLAADVNNEPFLLKIDEKKAEKLKVIYGLATGKGKTQIKKNLQPIIDELCQEINKAKDFYQSHFFQKVHPRWW